MVGADSLSNQHSFIAPLTSMAIIQVKGEQRHEYLHGQLTVNTKTFNTNSARLAAHCDFKGKMFAALFISDYKDAFLLGTNKDAAQESLTQLKKYGVFSKVDIELNTSLSVYGVSGESSIALLKVLFSELTQEHLHVSANEFGQVICFNDNSLRYLCYLSEKGLSRLSDIMDDQTFASEAAWEQLEIQAGLANVQQATVGEYVPQMLNFQALAAIDFDKGCYMGQEVVARTKFLGKNKRACFILSAECETLPETATVGSNVEISLEDNWRRAGTINRVSHINGKLNILAVMANDTELGSVVRLKDTEVLLNVCALPYSINN